MSEILMATKKLVKRYGKINPVEVLHGVDINIYEGDFTSLIGPSGSGKTTLLNILGTLDKASGGEIFFRGQSLGGKNSRALSDFRNKNIGFIFQFHHLLMEFTALENVLIPSWIEKGRPSKEKMSRAKELLEIVGLKDVINNKGRDLSGGQQQRIAIARALVNEPAIVLADEPTGNLDTENTDLVYNLLRKIHKETNTAFLIVTHDMELAKRCDKTIKMVDGKVRDYARNQRENIED